MEWTPRDLIAEMHRRIDREKLLQIHSELPGTTWDKFFDIDPFVCAAAQHALRLNEQLQPGSRCLDLGCGFGYVALALECLGHSCVAWDTPAAVLKRVAETIPVSERVFLHIYRDENDKEFLKSFDLIILHGVIPMRDAKGWWDWSAYAAFFRKLMNALNPGGMIEVICNWGDQIPIACNETAWKLLMEPGFSCVVNGNTITVRREAEVCAVS